MAPAQLTHKGNIMIEAPTAAAKVMTDLTCWKCGEESLKEKFETIDPNAFRAANAAPGLMQSECTKCGAMSINVAQSLHNKTAARKSRKAIIKAANGKSV
jgi:hypothetical protein